MALIFFSFLFIGLISIEALVIWCAHAFQSAYPCFNEFVFGSVTMIWKLIQVAYLWILFQNGNGVEDLLLQGSRSRQIMSYMVLIIFLIGWISSDFSALDCIQVLLQVTFSRFSLLCGFELKSMNSNLWILMQNFKVISFYQSSSMK